MTTKPSSSSTKTTSLHDRKSGRKLSLRNAILLLIVICFATISFMNMNYHGNAVPSSMNLAGIAMKMKDEFFAEPAIPRSEESVKYEAAAVVPKEKTTGVRDGDGNKNKNNIERGTLSCKNFGGPYNDEDVTNEMVYWYDIESDSKYKSPFLLQHEKQKKRLYLFFEPDGGGWNNIRMSIEVFIALAVVMGRTLVLPPSKPMYLLQKNKGHNNTKQAKHFGVEHFFPMEELAKDNDALEIITMEEFLKAEALTGHLVDRETKLPSYPPGNRTDWNGGSQQEYDDLRFWLRTVAYVPYDWKPGHCLATFPASGNHKDVDQLKQVQKEVGNVLLRDRKNQQRNKKNQQQNIEDIVSVDDTVINRLKDVMNNRKELCVYNETMQNELVIQFICSHKLGVRMLTYFYTFIFMENWKEDLWLKRFVRDHLRYLDEIQCAAARIIQTMREIAKKNSEKHGQENPNGEFDTFHIRRGDFQFKQTRIPVEEIYANTINILKDYPNTTIYIATDERDKKFFDYLRKHYHIYFMDDFIHSHLNGINTNYYGMIDQLIASRGRNFFGAFWSTFTGYITRLRGYRSQMDKLPGYESGILPTTYYYATKNKQFEMHKYVSLNGAAFNREFPTSWRLIDTPHSFTNINEFDYNKQKNSDPDNEQR